MMTSSMGSMFDLHMDGMILDVSRGEKMLRLYGLSDAGTFCVPHLNPACNEVLTPMISGKLMTIG